MSTAIEAHGLGKRYWVGGPRPPYRTLRETLVGGLTRLVRRERAEREVPIWALRDASFTVPQGRAVGVIGRNGAGKSTLLRVLARITEPTTGEATIRGRVGSLLEIGTGFHPELTGRDNIFLSGAILGMSRTEIRSKLDEIVAFSELERFVDTPVKRYSSGMYTRLAFSVAAHLEPDILLVDEVLAVGDAAFQRKCLGRMRDVTGEGRTVLFVSHNMAAVQALCPQGLLLDRGGIAFQGDIRDCVAHYLEDVTSQEAAEVDVSIAKRPQSFEPGLRIDRLTLVSPTSRPVLEEGDALVLSIRFSVHQRLEEVVLGVVVTSVENVRILECRSSHAHGSFRHLDPGLYEIRCSVRDHNLARGHYFVGVGARSATRHLDWVPDALRIQIYSAQIGRTPWLDDTDGLITVSSEWTAPLPLPATAIKVTTEGK